MTCAGCSRMRGGRMPEALAGVAIRSASATSLDAAVAALSAPMTMLLAESIRFQSVSGAEGDFTRFLARTAAELGLKVDLWQSNEEDVAGQPLKFGKHIPLAGRPTLVITLPGRGSGRSLMFNAHSD